MKVLVKILIICVFIISITYIFFGGKDKMLNINDIKQDALKFNNIITVPDFETSKEQIEQSRQDIIKKADDALQKIANLKKNELTFENTIGALDDISYMVDVVASRIGFMMNTSMDKLLREECEKQILVLQEWSIKTQYREDIYKIIKQYQDTKPTLSGESKKVFEDTIKGYERLGMHLSKEERNQIEGIKQEISEKAIEFSKNIREDKQTITFTKDELKGLTEEILSELPKNEQGLYVIDPKIRSVVEKVMKNADIEATRKRIYIERLSVAKDNNIEILDDVIKLRLKLANILGFKTWADYKIDINMAKKKDTVESFLIDLKDKLEDKFRKELKMFSDLKSKQEETEFMPWDMSYYKRKLIKEKYDIDVNELRYYFPYNEVLDGMFNIMSKVFSIDIKQVQPPYKWTEDLELFLVRDEKTKEPLGLFYLDMFPRPGKYTHFAQFGLISGKTQDGKKLRPVVSLVCNFDKPSKDNPTLLTFGQVETLFHEFGHVLHNMLSIAEFTASFGTSVPIDFVEVPSQLLENWLEDKDVLDTFAGHYKDRSKKIPKDIIDKLNIIKKLGIASFYRAQIAYGLIDMNLHNRESFKDNFDLVEYTNNILKEIYLPVPETTAFVAGFGHLMGYDAGYYGYAWADVISQDIAGVFKNSKKKYFDQELGLKLRKEIYEKGESREAKDLVKAFLGREYNMDAFIESLGIE